MKMTTEFTSNAENKQKRLDVPAGFWAEWEAAVSALRNCGADLDRIKIVPELVRIEAA